MEKLLGPTKKDGGDQPRGEDRSFIINMREVPSLLSKKEVTSLLSREEVTLVLGGEMGLGVLASFGHCTEFSSPQHAPTWWEGHVLRNSVGDGWCWMVGFEWSGFYPVCECIKHRCHGGISMAYGWRRNELLGR